MTASGERPATGEPTVLVDDREHWKAAAYHYSAWLANAFAALAQERDRAAVGRRSNAALVEALEAERERNERMWEAISNAQSEDGVNADDAPGHWRSHEASAWAEGFEAGQDSVQRHLDGVLPNPNAPPMSAGEPVGLRPVRKDDTPEGKAIWESVDRAAERASPWIKERLMPSDPVGMRSVEPQT